VSDIPFSFSFHHILGETRLSPPLRGPFSLYKYICVCTFNDTNICIYTYIYIQIYVHTYMYVYIMYTYMYRYVYMYMYIFTYMYTYNKISTLIMGTALSAEATPLDNRLLMLACLPYIGSNIFHQDICVYL
jgi:hypothetical protein